MELKEVVSSNINQIGYDESSETLRIVFRGGSTYDYKDVPSDVYNELMNSDSIGRFISAKVKDVYNYDRVA